MALLRYPGDVGDGLPKVIGGRFKVIRWDYDETTDTTLVEVKPLKDPLDVVFGD